MRRLGVTAVALTSALALAVGLETTVENSNHYRLGNISFTATFPASPVLTTFARPQFGFGGFSNSAFVDAGIWQAGTSSVMVARLDVSNEKLIDDLRSTAKIWKASLTNVDGTWILEFTQHFRPGKSGIEPWYHGIIEIRDSEFFYAWGSGQSSRLARKFVPTFRILSA
jgi:hypothetical protein